MTELAAEAAASSTPAEEPQPRHDTTAGTDATRVSGTPAGDLHASRPSSRANAASGESRRQRLSRKAQDIRRRARQKFGRQESGVRAEEEKEDAADPVQSEPVPDPESASIDSASGSGDDGGSGATLPRSVISPAPEVGGKTEAGWAAVARSIRDIDEQKIKGYTEDIDNILVFAGLYSAVLTALLVESYQGLQPDPSSIMITLLGQLVTQTHAYKFTNGYLNSTLPPLDVAAIPLQFQPSLAARRVNVLWFASLTLSLISASFGILVKQWLREYLSGESVSPLAQLRIRHFRTPGLDHWRVFTIAALLPLILQLALALFFVGLCFFTIDIHHSIGYTTIPLVAGWAFLFIAALLAPAISPRCPYKIPVFRYVTAYLRNGLFHGIRLVKGIRKYQLPKKSEWPITSNWTWQTLGYNEANALKDRRKDVEILIDVDASQTDDQLVMQMCGALKETHAEPARIIDFVLKIIASRVPHGEEVQKRPIPPMLDLSQLPVQTSTILMDAVADVLAREVRQFPESKPIKWNAVMHDCLFLLIARLPCLLSKKAMEAVSLCFTGTRISRLKGTFEEILNEVPPKDLQCNDLQKRLELCLHLLERLRTAFMSLNAWQLRSTILTMAKMCYCTCGDCKTFTDVVGEHNDTMTSTMLVYHMGDVLSEYMLLQVKNTMEWNEWHREVLLSLVGLWRDTGKPSDTALHELVRHMVTKPKYATYFYRLLFHRAEFDERATDLFSAALISSNDLEQALVNLHSVFTTYVDETMQRPELLNEEFYENLFCFISGQMEPMERIVGSQTPSVVEAVYLPLWQKTWKAMHRAMSSPPRTKGLAYGARICLEEIERLEGWWQSHLSTGDLDEDVWAEIFDPAKAFFDSNIIQDLMRFLPPSEYVWHRCICRIHRLQVLEEESTEEDYNGLGADEDSADDSDADAAVAAEERSSGLSAPPDGTLEIPPRPAGSTGACQADDRLVMKMCSALKSMETEPDLTLDFVLKIIGLQLRTEFKRPLPRVLDLRQLPGRTHTILVKTVANIFTCELGKLPESDAFEWTGLFGDCLSLLVARLPRPLSAQVMADVLPRFTNGEAVQRALEKMFASAKPEEQQDLCVLRQHLLRHAFPCLDVRTFRSAIHNATKACCTCGSCHDINRLLEKHAGTISSALKQHTYDMLASFTVHDVQVRTELDYGHRHNLSILFGQWTAGAEDVPWRGMLDELMPRLLADPKFAPEIYPLLFDKAVSSIVTSVFGVAFISSKTKHRVLINMHNAFICYIDNWHPSIREDYYYLRLLSYADGQMAPMMHVVNHGKRAVVEAMYLPIWRLIWTTMHNGMSGFVPSKRTEITTERASTCLKKIDELDNLWLPTSKTQADAAEDFDSWAKAFDPAKSFFDDDVIEDLMKFLPKRDFARYKRARRIQQIRELKWVQDEQTPRGAEDDDGHDDSRDDDKSRGGDGRAGEDDNSANPVAAHTAVPTVQWIRYTGRSTTTHGTLKETLIYYRS